ncbi:hypothetical protein SAMN06265360_13112 [Haloechinothrix alba]|uniref:Uncharacterized protein n=2 Tax=Haloechinothrix alba TaxID=664784 RepID=A0A239A6L7_9PSEU|nr:hypothetical protein SAMN06265360_13112 [Haloechinothrix alba]
MAAAKELTDPLTGQVYAMTEDGFVEVYDPSTGQRGIFNEKGEWQSGELKYANRQLLGWMGRAAARQAMHRERG